MRNKTHTLLLTLQLIGFALWVFVFINIHNNGFLDKCAYDTKMFMDHIIGYIPYYELLITIITFFCRKNLREKKNTVSILIISLSLFNFLITIIYLLFILGLCGADIMNIH